MTVSGSSNNTPSTLMDAQEHIGNLIVETDASARDCGGFIIAAVIGLEDKHAKHTKVLNEAMLAKDVVVEEQKTKIDDLTTAMVAMKKENEALAASKKEANKWKTKCNSLAGKLEAFAKAEKDARDNMKQRHEDEIQRFVDLSDSAVEQAVASAVEEKDEEIRALERKILLFSEFRRTSTGSTASDASSP